MLSHGVTFNLGSAKVCSPAIIETYFSLEKSYVDCCNKLLNVLLLNCAISIGSYTSINTFYSFIVYRHFIKHHFSTNIIWTFT